MNSDDLPADLVAALLATARTPRLLVASDYDGTLAPLVADPAAARPHPESVQVLGELATLGDTAVAVVSGRALRDLTALSGLGAPVHLVGSHGAEFADGFVHEIDADAVALHARLHAELTSILDGHRGVGLETKPASIAVHVRNAPAGLGERVLKRVRTGPAGWGGVHVTEGKAVIELAVIATDKGQALELLRSRTDSGAAVFFGDDVTDEKAFRRLHAPDVGVKVGGGASLAAFRVAATEHVATALALLLRERGRWLRE